MIAALRPMRARFAAVSRFMMLSTAWSRVDEFWRIWESNDPTWIRIKSLADDNPRYSQAFLDNDEPYWGKRLSDASIWASRLAKAPRRLHGSCLTRQRRSTSRACCQVPISCPARTS